MAQDAYSFEAHKEEIVSGRRRVIFNNDGCDVFRTPGNPGGLIEDFLKERTAPLINTHVDVISYTTISSGFGLFTHNTGIGEILTRKHPARGGNIAPLLIEKGKDCLELMVDFGHGNNMEVFWAMRMNDTHDGAHRPESPCFLFPALKQEHPEYLIGAPDRIPSYGAWSAVDYSHSQIRQLAFLAVEEVCKNYDVDGIELDFFRHPVFFKQTSEGLPVGNEERSMMTGLMRNIAGMLEAEGRKRRRPFMLAVRTPDDVAYCNTIGLEIEKWMAEGLIDIYIPSGYFRLNTWEYSVGLGHEYRVKVYPGLSESRVGGGHHKDSLRSSDEGYRARAMNAWSAGADGIYIFNLFDPGRRIWREIGEPEILKNLDKVYFPSFRGSGRVAGGAYPHNHFINIPSLNPGEPVMIVPGERKSVKIDIGEKPAASPGEDPPKIQLSVKILPDLKDMENFTISFNGKKLSGARQNKNIEFMLKADNIRKGQNTLEVRFRGERGGIQIADVMVRINYSGASFVDEFCVEQTRHSM